MDSASAEQTVRSSRAQKPARHLLDFSPKVDFEEGAPDGGVVS